MLARTCSSMFAILMVSVLLAGCQPATPATKPTRQPTAAATAAATSAVAVSGTPARPTFTPKPTTVEVGPVVGGPAGTDGYPWWHDTVFYLIYIRSFYDSNNDGIGDVRGVTQKLNYLRDLGIGGIQLMVVNPAVDLSGYTVTNHTDIRREYGTLEWLRELVALAHLRGMRVILDLNLHSTSSEHAWFKAAKDPTSPYRDWYIWSEADQGLSDWGTQVWFWSEGGYYLSQNGRGFANLNLDHPGASQAMLDAALFWLREVGVDGFRVDGAKGLVPEGRTLVNTDSTHAWLRGFRTRYKQTNPLALAFGEVWETETRSIAPYAQGDELDLVTAFPLTWAIHRALLAGNAGELNQVLRSLEDAIPKHAYTTFISNHDQDRIMSQSATFNYGTGVGLGENPARAKAAASLYLTAPGVPFLYFGEEIGMRGVRQDDSGADVAEQIFHVMQWTGDANGGFSAKQPVPPLKADAPYLQTYNVASEQEDPGSILTHYRALIALRNAHPALRVGDLSLPTSGHSGLYAALRVSSFETALVLVNLGGNPVSDYALAIPSSRLAEGTHRAVGLMGDGPFAPLTVGAGGGFSGYKPVESMPAYGTLVIQLQPQ